MRYWALLSALVLEACQRGPANSMSSDAGSTPACLDEAGVHHARLGFGLGYHYPAYINLERPDGAFSLFAFDRPPFNLTGADLCRTRMEKADTSIDCDLPLVGEVNPSTLTHRHATIQITPSRMRLAPDEDGGAHQAAWDVPAGQCWRLDVGGAASGDPIDRVVRHASQAACADDRGVSREESAFLKLDLKTDAYKEKSLAVTLVSTTLDIRKTIADLHGVRLCQTIVSPARDAVAVRCDSSDDGVAPVVARAYAVPGRLWTAETTNDAREAPIPIPCGVRVRFDPTDVCKVAPRMCRPARPGVAQ